MSSSRSAPSSGPTDYDMYGVANFPAASESDPHRHRRLRSSRATRIAHWRCMPTRRRRGAGHPGAGAGFAQRRRRGRRGARHARHAQPRSRSCRRRCAGRSSFLECIRDTLPEAILVGRFHADRSTRAISVSRRPRPGSWFNSATGYGTLGYALPASTGAGLGAPDRPVVCLVGDGGIAVLDGRAGRAARCRCVARDRRSGTTTATAKSRPSMLAVDIEPVGVDVEPPDFSHIARAYGYAHQVIDSTRSACSAR